MPSRAAIAERDGVMRRVDVRVAGKSQGFFTMCNLHV